jgi:hydroxymethylglutaryl-CoA reductase (NADPH)
VAESTSRYAKLIDVLVTLEGANIYLRFVYEVGQAAGQNMVTIATDAACRWIEQNTPVKPRRWYVEANLSGDKKACAQSFQGIRGRKVVAEATLPGVLVRSKLQCTPEEMVECYRVSAMGGVLSGALGIQGHYANALAALYIATGQDAACVAESAMGVTRFETRDEDALYVSVTMPNVIVGTVGGGTSLPTARACLDILGLTPGADGSANALAEVVAGLCLAGELSIIAALAAGHFADAHRRLARGDTEPPTRETTP